MCKPRLTCVLGLSVMIGTLGWAQFSPTQDSQQPDNTSINQRDRNQAELTADQQKENKSDRETARQIRRAIVEDKSLSTYAHNIKIIAQNGTVTLKGPVRSEEEKRAVEKKASEIAGKGNVRSEIEVASGEEANR